MPRTSATTRVPKAEVDSVLAACQLLVAISVQSFSTVSDEVTVVQLRILVMLASRGTATLSDVATATGLHVSKASRTCDQMVKLGLLDRASDPYDRRSVRLTPTRAGKDIVNVVTQTRRAAIEPALRKMSRSRREGLVSLLHELTSAAGEPDEPSLWSLGWVTA